MTMRNSLIIVAILFFVYALFLNYGPKAAQPKMQSQWQSNQYCIEKYLRDSKVNPVRHKIVFVGSSLTSRLDLTEEFGCVYNLSLNGGSALTGLSVITHSTARPRLVFVEINVPERGVDQDLIAKSSEFLPQVSAVFHVGNMPVNLATSFLYSFIYSLHKSKPFRDVNEFARLKGIAERSKNDISPLPTDTLKSNIAEFSRLVKDIESKGTKVVFFEMPIHPDLELYPRAVQIRNAFKSSFPNYSLLSFTELAEGSTVKTTDGMHLSDNEARNVVRNLREYIDSSEIMTE